jgi:hypothetical protein
MKKFLQFLLAGCFLWWCKSPANAQNSPNEFVVSGGVGFSLVPLLVDINSLGNYSSNSNSYSGSTAYTNSSIPAISGAVDYGIFNEFSIGAGLTYQTCTVNVSDWFNQFTGLNENVTENISRLNIRVRISAHWDFADNHAWEMYGGIGVGYSFWTDGNNANDPTFPSDAPWDLGVGSKKLVSIQGFLGIRGYFTENVGAHVEVAVGSPYFFDIGLNLRFGGVPLNLRDEK